MTRHRCGFAVLRSELSLCMSVCVSQTCGRYPWLFAGDDCFAGACLCTRTAVDAGIGVDVVDVALRDSAHGANGEAGAASDTRVGDYVSHSCQCFIS